VAAGSGVETVVAVTVVVPVAPAVRVAEAAGMSHDGRPNSLRRC